MDPEKCCESGCTPCERDPVGSEPRDLCNYIDGEFVCHSNDDWMNVLKPATGERFGRVPPVSYTHLTLPTICSV